MHDKLDTVFPMMTMNLIQYTIKLQITIKNVSMTLQANRNNNKFYSSIPCHQLFDWFIYMAAQELDWNKHHLSASDYRPSGFELDHYHHH